MRFYEISFLDLGWFSRRPVAELRPTELPQAAAALASLSA